MDSQSLNEDPESPSDSGALHGEPFTPPLSSAYEPITAYELTLNQDLHCQSLTCPNFTPDLLLPPSFSFSRNLP